ncbi:hypothetical protein CTAYLR_001960 [Chrysophaeum taylorii]|uniref:Uncharacterized protein n=1 Tax=Chrysophaeum taylorii TaxID=2483200 RepID=A0AAD7U8L9_9STRA|nr:hypothetical protein CTAYLR_001960 [Chrysophaeum taylorii]
MDEDDWRSSASESEIGRRDLARLENELVSDGYREGVTSAREAGMQRVSVRGFEQGVAEVFGEAHASGCVLGAIEALAMLESSNDELQAAAARARTALIDDKMALGDDAPLRALLERYLTRDVVVGLLDENRPRVTFSQLPDDTLT